MKGLEICRNGGEPIRTGSEDGLVLVMFNHIERFGITDFYASVTEYATGDRYRYASESIEEGDVYEIRYTEFDSASEPIKLDKKGERPVTRRESQEYEAPDYAKEGVDEFYKSIHEVSYLSNLRMYGAFVRSKLVGVIAT